MIKNLASSTVAFVMIASPLLVSAQASSVDSNAVVIAQLQALIVQSLSSVPEAVVKDYLAFAGIKAEE